MTFSRITNYTWPQIKFNSIWTVQIKNQKDLQIRAMFKSNMHGIQGHT